MDMRGRYRFPKRKRVSLWLLAAALLAADVWAAQNGEKTVRVGYVDALNYEEGGPGEYKRGTGYEFCRESPI